MKKFLSILMAVAVILSSVSVFGVSAAEGYAAKNPITDSFSSYDEFISENADKEIYGYDYKFLYEEAIGVDWSKLNIWTNKMGYPVQSTAESISLAASDMNSYLKRVINNYFIGERLYTEEYAIGLINFFGKMINPNFVEVNKAFDRDTTPNESDFYDIIAVKSGFADMIQLNWCDKGVNFKPFLTAFGVDLSKILNSDFQKGKPVARALLGTIINTLISFGPIDYAMMILGKLSSDYSTVLYEATTSLFSLKINCGKPVRNGNQIGRTEYSVEELKSVSGFLTYAFDGIIDYDFFKFPDSRVSVSQSNPEKLLFYMMYFAINYRYNNNADFIDSLAGKITTFLTEGNRYMTAGYTYEEICAITQKIPGMVDMIFKGDVTAENVEMLAGLTQENLDSFSGDLGTQLKNWLSKILRKISDYIDYLFKLFTGEIKYGESLLD